jgi:UDP-N-acetylmuramoyl-tripeptide--D-alanyl-D-alanine ligase
LGKFQSDNLEVVVKVALFFKMPIDEVKFAIENLKPIPHRLEKIVASGRIILDDGYNGNIDGMLEAFRLVEEYPGRKIIITPGLVESSDELNERIAYEIDEIFDLVIIIGSVNMEFFKEKLINTKHIKIFLKDKSKLEEVLMKHTRNGDLILFANDTPAFM